MEDCWLLVCLSLAIVAVTSLLLRHHHQYRRLPPGPPAFPIVGNLFWLRRSFSLREVEPLLRELRPRYGPIHTPLPLSRSSILPPTPHAVQMATAPSPLRLSLLSSPAPLRSSHSICPIQLSCPRYCSKEARLRPKVRRLAVTATAAAAAPTAAPLSAGTPSTEIVLVERSDAEKVNRLKLMYLDKVVPILKEEFSYKNIHEIPKIEKIVVNCGMGDAEQNSKGLEAAMKDLALITGQRPVKTKAKYSIASFKLREGATVGLAVTLRGNVMYSFLDRLINLGLPRTRDFQGVNPNSFDGHGNYSVGFRDQSVFPEIRYEALGRQRGMDVCITTTAKTDNEGQRLLALFGMPFRQGGGTTVMFRKKKKKAVNFDTKSRGRKK